MENQTTSKGYIYVLINSSMPNLVKIGKTTKDPNERVKELSSATGVATPFILVYNRQFNNCHTAEKQVHMLLEDKGLRHNSAREFFEISTTDAIHIIQSIEDEEINDEFIDDEEDEDLEVTQEEKDEYYPFFYNNAFEDVGNSSALYLNEISDTIRYKGNIFVIVNGTTVSAAEYFVAMLAQSPKVKILGEQTSGGLAQPLVTVLPSGMRVFINSSKTFDTKGNDISSGIKPDYEYDFSNIYNIKNPQERLKKFIEVIKKITIR